MKKEIAFQNIGFYAADSRFYDHFKRQCPEIESESILMLKEWDIVRESRNIILDIPLLKQYEREIGDPVLWNALVGDRRIYSGKRHAFAQDYKPKFTHDEMLAILQCGLQRMEQFFDSVQPNLVISFQCVTLGEYLSFLFAKARGIPLLNLRPTRINNYIYAGEDILEPSKKLYGTYQYFIENGIEQPLKARVSQYLENMRETHAMYEGVVPPSSKPPTISGSKKNYLKNFLGAKPLLGLLFDEYRYRFGTLKNDTHVYGYILPLVGQQIVRPVRARLMEKLFKTIYVNKENIGNHQYAFFPLHPEPEVTVNVYSKPYLNQIEAIRLISHNLPIGMKLIVKEHPWHVGKRTLSYYRKLLEIPNVMLCSPEINSRDLVSNAQLITVISGSIGLEGLMLKVPVIVLGRAPFNFMPSLMIRNVENPDSLGFEIRNLLDNYRYDETAMQCYVAAVIKDSVAIDFYSILSEREGTYVPSNLHADETNKQIERERQVDILSRYLINRYEEFSCHNNYLA